MLSTQSPDFNDCWLNSELNVMGANKGSSFILLLFQLEHDYIEALKGSALKKTLKATRICMEMGPFMDVHVIL